MITNKSKFLNNLPDAFYSFMFLLGLAGAVLGIVGFFASPWYFLAFSASIISGIMIGGVLTCGYVQLQGPHLSLLQVYESAHEQVRKDIGEITVKQIQEMSGADAERVKDAVIKLSDAYNKHRASIPDSRVAVLLDNAETATKAYQELT